MTRSRGIEELILHGGPPKTATTNLQAALADAASTLAQHGVLMPLATGDEPGQHIPILRELCGDTS